MKAAHVWILLAATGTLLGQGRYTAGDVEDGRRLFLANCAICHGPEGDSVPGVDLGHGKFRRATSDDDLTQIITNGIAGTAMPPHSFNGFQTHTVIAYLRSMASLSRSASSAGDPVRGKVLFEGKGECTNCHRVREKGSRTGPDLTEIGSVRRAVELERSLVEPDAEILPQNRYIRVVTRDGKAITGRLLNQDTFTVQLLDPNERLVSLSKANLQEYTFAAHSPMPSYAGRMTPGEIADVVSYLVSLKGVE